MDSVKAFWLSYRHLIIAAVIAGAFAYASFRISPLACGLSLASVACVVAALKFFKKA